MTPSPERKRMTVRTAFFFIFLIFVVIASIPIRFGVFAIGSRIPDYSRTAGSMVDVYLSIYERFMGN
jgi:hypothetical protein